MRQPQPVPVGKVTERAARNVRGTYSKIMINRVTEGQGQGDGNVGGRGKEE